MTAYSSWVQKDAKTRADLYRGTSGRDKGSEVPMLPRNYGFTWLDSIPWKKFRVITKSDVWQWNRIVEVVYRQMSY